MTTETHPYEIAYRAWLQRLNGEACPKRKDFNLSRRQARAIRWNVEGIKTT